MRRKGYEFKRADHLTYRMYDPERDADRHTSGSEPGSGSYVVIVSYKKCGQSGPCSYCGAASESACQAQGCLWDPRVTQYDVGQAPCLPFACWSRTNMLYGKWRKNKEGTGRWFRGGDSTNQWCETYWTCPVYWVEGGRVYTSTAYRKTDPEA